MKNSLLLLAIFTLIFIFTGCNEPTEDIEAAAPAGPVNVILMIGDGMGLSQVSSAYYFMDKTPNFSKFPHIGLINTSSSKEKVTDSASGATAYSTGKRTYNGAIAVADDSNQRCTKSAHVLSLFALI